jgi:hypothetical protein
MSMTAKKKSSKTTARTAQAPKAPSAALDAGRAAALAKLAVKPEGKGKKGAKPTEGTPVAETPPLAPATEPTATEPAVPAVAPAVASEPAATIGEPTTALSAQPGKKARAPKPKNAPKPAKPKRLSALDAAAQVLASSDKPMRAIDMVSEMEAKGLWRSPGGKTPEATLYAAIIREIAAKGKTTRFAKHGKGLFRAA